MFEDMHPRMAHSQAAESASIANGGREASPAWASLDNVPLAIFPCVTRSLSDGVARCDWMALMGNPLAHGREWSK
jgi:hypothetical protein